MGQRVAIITGGSRGIGAAIAQALAADGFDIAISYARNAEAANTVVAKIEKLGCKALALQADSGKIEDNQSLIQKVVAAFGRLDVLVCNAGVYPYANIAKMKAEEIDSALNLNIRGVMIESLEAVKHMQAGGRLIFIGSAFADRSPFANIPVYSATKAALGGFARGLARDLGPRGITVNVVQPGPIDTDLNPATGGGADMLRNFLCVSDYGVPNDIASFVAFLAGPKSSFITGAALTIDGGLTA